MPHGERGRGENDMQGKWIYKEKERGDISRRKKEREERMRK